MNRWSRIAFWIVVAGQVLFLLGFIAVKETALRSGTEVVLQTVPVDPRSLMQGDYAILDYEIASLPQFMQDQSVGNTIYVFLKEGPDVWTAARYSVSEQSANGELFIKGRVDRTGHADFGIDTYFVPEGSGYIVETAQDVKVVVKVATDGSAIIKDLLVDGRPFDPDSENP